MKIKSFFQITPYLYQNQKHSHYPCFKLDSYVSVFCENIKEVERYIKDCGAPNNLYAFVVTELPFNCGIRTTTLSESLSRRVYLPDGTLWGVQPYANMDPEYCGIPQNTILQGNRFGKMRAFSGRELEEIKFMPGDIIEVFGFVGNPYWSSNEVNLAVVLKCPPKKDDMEYQITQYKKTHDGYGLTDNVLENEFGYNKDDYTIASYETQGNIDYCPTIAALPVNRPISPQMKAAMNRLYNKYKD